MIQIPHGGYELISKQTIRGLLPANPIIFECGAYNGSDTYEMAVGWPDCQIYAFEPLAHIYSHLENRVGHLPNVKTIPTAIWDRVGVHTMFVSSGGSTASSSLRRPKDHLSVNPHVIFQHQATVPVTTFDEFMRTEGVDRVDFLWLDMQGTEFESLAASPRTCSSASVIYAEVALKEVYEANVLYDEFRKWMEGQGFSVYAEALDYVDQGDVLFVRRDRVP